MPSDFDPERDLCDSYYAAIAELRRRYLAGEPVTIGGCRVSAQSADAIEYRSPSGLTVGRIVDVGGEK